MYPEVKVEIFQWTQTRYEFVRRVDPISVEWENVYNDIDSCRLVVGEQLDDTLTTQYVGRKHFVCISDNDDNVLFFGPIVHVLNRYIKGISEIRCNGFTEVLKFRISEMDTKYSGVAVNTMIQNFLSYTQGKDYGDMHIELVNHGTFRNRERTLIFRPMAQLLLDFSNKTRDFDFKFVVDKDSRTINKIYLHLYGGQTLGNTVITTWRENVDFSDIWVHFDSTALRTREVALGRGWEDVLHYNEYTNEALLPSYGRWEYVGNYKRYVDYDTLYNFAHEDVAQFGTPYKTVWVEWVGKEYSTMEPGYSVKIQIGKQKFTQQIKRRKVSISEGGYSISFEIR